MTIISYAPLFKKKRANTGHSFEGEDIGIYL